MLKCDTAYKKKDIRVDVTLSALTQKSSDIFPFVSCTTFQLIVFFWDISTFVA